VLTKRNSASRSERTNQPESNRICLRCDSIKYNKYSPVFSVFNRKSGSKIWDLPSAISESRSQMCKSQISHNRGGPRGRFRQNLGRFGTFGARFVTFGARFGTFGARFGTFGVPFWHFWEPVLALSEPVLALSKGISYMDPGNREICENGLPKVPKRAPRRPPKRSQTGSESAKTGFPRKVPKPCPPSAFPGGIAFRGPFCLVVGHPEASTRGNRIFSMCFQARFWGLAKKWSHFWGPPKSAKTGSKTTSKQGIFLRAFPICFPIYCRPKTTPRS